MKYILICLIIKNPHQTNDEGCNPGYFIEKIKVFVFV